MHPVKFLQNKFINLSFWSQKRRFGQSLKPAQQWAKIPILYFLFTGFFRYLSRKKSPINQSLRMLTCIRVAQLQNCQFCLDFHLAQWFSNAGLKETIIALEKWPNCDYFSSVENDVLTYIEILLQKNTIPSSLRNALVKQLTEAGLIELTALIGIQTCSTIFNNAFQFQNQGLCQIQLPKNSK